ncbi:MAG TPA: cytochrome c [Candidatus Dormibacteraeota bacterium]|nr:cytochrome c [Candidatus Dormibacteraeota bacterium]
MRSLAVAALALAVAGCARGAHETTAASASAALAKNPASASDGAVIYLANCASCHQADGRGVPGAFPPLAENPVVTGNPIAAIAIVKNGLEGRIVVNGQTYSGIMPRWKGLMTDEQIASVISYIRSSWKNHAPGVSISDVESVK